MTCLPTLPPPGLSVNVSVSKIKGCLFLFFSACLFCSFVCLLLMSRFLCFFVSGNLYVCMFSSLYESSVCLCVCIFGYVCVRVSICICNCLYTCLHTSECLRASLQSVVVCLCVTTDKERETMCEFCKL